MSWLDVFTSTPGIRPARPATQNIAGRDKTVDTVAMSSTSSTSSTKKEKETLSGNSLHKEKEITQVSYKNPESVRHNGNALCQKGNEKNAVGRAYGEKAFPLGGVDSADEPTPAQLIHARRMLVDCPFIGGKRHCWHCSRCGDVRTCSAWKVRRADVEFFRQSEEPYSLYLVEGIEAGEAVQ